MRLNRKILDPDCEWHIHSMPDGTCTCKPGRPGFHDILMQMAVLISMRSTCLRLKVGTVISSTDFRKVLSMGYNGNASGLANQCDRTGAEAVGNCGCLHSEENAVINCDAPRSTEKVVFVTHLPCVMCAKRLINLGNVKRVYYLHDYRIRDSLEWLRNADIRVESMADKEINDAVDRWHNRVYPPKLSMQDVLIAEFGFNEEEFKAWQVHATVPERILKELSGEQ